MPKGKKPARPVDVDLLLRAIREQGPCPIYRVARQVLGYNSDGTHKGLLKAIHELERRGLVRGADARWGRNIRRVYSAIDRESAAA